MFAVFFALFLALVQLVAGSPMPAHPPAPVPVPESGMGPRDEAADPHEADFRTFGVSGCYSENQGIYTLTQSQASHCYAFSAPIGSLLLVDSSCTLTIYKDTACSESGLIVPINVCQNGVWQSYELTC